MLRSVEAGLCQHAVDIDLPWFEGVVLMLLGNARVAKSRSVVLLKLDAEAGSAMVGEEPTGN